MMPELLSSGRNAIFGTNESTSRAETVRPPTDASNQVKPEPSTPASVAHQRFPRQDSDFKDSTSATLTAAHSGTFSQVTPKQPSNSGPAKSAILSQQLSPLGTFARFAKPLAAFLFYFDLKSNPMMILHQIKHASVITTGGDHYLMMYSHYYPKNIPGFQGFLHTDGLLYSADPSSKKSVLVAAKINHDSKGAIITYGHSVEAERELILDVASLNLNDSSACYLASMEHVPAGSAKDAPPTLALQLYNSTTKKSRILLTSKAAVSRTKSFFQLLELNSGADFLVVFQKSLTELKVVLAPSDNNLFHTYFGRSAVIRMENESSVADIRDFSIDSQLETGSLTKQTPLQSDSNTSASYSTNEFDLIVLVQKNTDISENEQHISRQFVISLGKSVQVNPEADRNCSVQEWKHFECSEFKVAQTIQKEVPEDWKVQVEPAKVRFCSKLKQAFLFGTAVASIASESKAFVFEVMFSPDSPNQAKVAVQSRTTTPLEFDMTQIKVAEDGRHKKLMPPVDQKFMIAENPFLRSPTGLLDPVTEPAFIFGVANDDVFFCCYVVNDTLEVKDAKEYLQSRINAISKKEIKHITSISWVKTPEHFSGQSEVANLSTASTADSLSNTRSSKFTICANRFAVLTLDIK